MKWLRNPFSGKKRNNKIVQDISYAQGKEGKPMLLCGIAAVCLVGITVVAATVL